MASNPTPINTGDTPSAPEEQASSDATAISKSPLLRFDQEEPAHPHTADSLEKQPTVLSKNPPLKLPSLLPGASVSEMGRRLVGTKLGPFVLEKFIGGGMGAVFRALDTSLGRPVAVKVLSQSWTDEDTIRRFKIEAQSAARLNHENIARVYHVGEVDGWSYIVFEFIEGSNVRDIVERTGPLSVEEALRFTAQIAQALEHACRRDVVHRDIKPSNVVITPEGQAKLVDMGLARLHQVEASSGDLTASGVTLGTFDYISPEQARDPRSADVRSDIYSLGCTLYFMLAGRPPFPDGTMMQKLLNHSSEPPPDLREFCWELPEETVKLVNKMLAKQPADRHQTPDELLDELAALGRQLGMTDWTIRPVRQSPPRESHPIEKHLPWMAPTAALIVLVWLIDYLAPSAAIGFRTEPLVQVRRARPSAVAPAPDEPPSQEPDHVDGSPKDAANPVASSSTDSTSSKASSATPAEESERGADEPQAEELNGSGAAVNSESDGADEPAGASSSSKAASARGGATSSESQDSPNERLIAAATHPNARPLGGAVESADKIVVALEDDPATNALLASSLQEACELAESLGGVDTIELRFSGLLQEKPFSISASSLTIRAANGFQPVICFQPQIRDTSENTMISLAGGEVSWQGVDLLVRLPDEPAERWSLFRLQHVESLHLQDCWLTIENAVEGYYHEQVAFFAFAPLTAAETMPRGDAEAPMEAARIRMTRCVARGGATLVRAEEAAPFSLQWEQGLCVTNERLVETGGAARELAGSESISIELSRVTASLERGLCLVKTTSAAPYPLPLEIDNRHCILITDATAPLIELDTRDGGQTAGRAWSYRGERNFYLHTEIFLRERTDYLHPNEVHKDQWSQVSSETHFDDTVLWTQQDRASLPPAHEQTPRHFRLLKSPDNPALGMDGGEGIAGFDPVALPPVPASADDQ